jgi:hypothetical protein
MHDPLFTVLLPVHRPPSMLPFAIESVLAQQVQDFELFVVCDGAPQQTVDVAKRYAARHKRVRVFAFEKGERFGEVHRHSALQHARSRYVAQLADDDIWFPDYLSELAALLEEVEFGNLLQPELTEDHKVWVQQGDLADPHMRHLMLTTPRNLFGPSCAGYRLATYRSLPVGWSPAPPELGTDLHMWRKFMNANVSMATRFSIQTLKLSASLRADMTNEERHAESARLAEHFRDPQNRRNFQAQAWQSYVGFDQVDGVDIGASP